MELWIRSQGKGKLIKVEALRVQDDNIVANERDIIGTYTSEKRLKEILDEIQKKMVEKYLLKEVEHINYGNMDDLRKYYKRKEINFVEVPNGIELEPINKDILVYEMPDE